MITRKTSKEDLKIISRLGKDVSGFAAFAAEPENYDDEDAMKHYREAIVAAACNMIALVGPS